MDWREARDSGGLSAHSDGLGPTRRHEGKSQEGEEDTGKRIVEKVSLVRPRSPLTSFEERERGVVEGREGGKQWKILTKRTFLKIKLQVLGMRK